MRGSAPLPLLISSYSSGRGSHRVPTRIDLVSTASAGHSNTASSRVPRNHTQTDIVAPCDVVSHRPRPLIASRNLSGGGNSISASPTRSRITNWWANRHGKGELTRID
jgi:hypothetical protein